MFAIIARPQTISSRTRADTKIIRGIVKREDLSLAGDAGNAVLIGAVIVANNSRPSSFSPERVSLNGSPCTVSVKVWDVSLALMLAEQSRLCPHILLYLGASGLTKPAAGNCGPPARICATHPRCNSSSSA